MSKKHLKRCHSLYSHDDHLDLYVDPKSLPFEVKFGEKLDCGVKEINPRYGTKLPFRIGIWIAKKCVEEKENGKNNK